MKDYYTQALELFEYTRALRRDFHRHPEIGFQEVRTAGIVSRELNELGLEVTTGVAQTGVVALLEGARPGPVILLRFDMDALPVQEETGAPYASTIPGVMHACGHDAHTSIGLTVARLLQKRSAELPGKVKFIFQPAEEGLGGAERMLAEGILTDPRPEYSLALHIWNEKPLGWMGIRSGPLMAASEIFTVKIFGKGGHGAMPDKTVDPVLAAAHVITALQSILSRNVPSLDAAVLSVTSVHGGDAFNVIPPSVEMKGTIRTYRPEVRSYLLERFHQVVKGVAESLGCTVVIDLCSTTPAVVNDPGVTRTVQTAAQSLWPESEVDDQYQTLVSEDMAFIMEQAPGCYFMMGSANAERGLTASHHHPRFDFDEAVLPRAAALMAAAAHALLNGV